MKTLKALKAATIWSCIFCLSCILCNVCMFFNGHSYSVILEFIGILSAYGWMANPFPMIFCVRGLKAYIKEYKNPTDKQLIGKKWILFLILPIITTVFFLFGGVTFVEITGGV